MYTLKLTQTQVNLIGQALGQHRSALDALINDIGVQLTPPQPAPTEAPNAGGS